jgi:Fe-S oxidoreductase
LDLVSDMQIENPITTTENCRYCLMCRHTCPVGFVTNLETLTPRGWGLTIASVKRGLLTWNDETVDALYSCADCGLCRAHCVTDQPLPEAIAAARAEVAAKNLAPPIVYELDTALKTWGNPYEEKAPDSAMGQGEVALFVGDDACYLWPSALEAVLTLLHAVGVEPVLVGVGRNNGYLPSSLGLLETATSLARANLDEIQATGASRVLVLTPGDFDAFSRVYDERLGLAWPEGVQLMEVLDFLAQQLEAGELGFNSNDSGAPFAYVDPTHSVRVDGRYHAPRKLLSAVMGSAGVDMFWREGRAHPSGNVALQFTQPAIADLLTQSRLIDAANAGAGRVITEDPGGLAQLNRHASAHGLQVEGLYELLAEHLSNA